MCLSPSLRERKPARAEAKYESDAMCRQCVEPATAALRSTMERAEWSDVRLDERMASIDNTFERIDHSLRDLGDEMRSMRGDLTAEIRAINQRLTQIGFGLAGILAAGLITVVGTQL